MTPSNEPNPEATPSATPGELASLFLRLGLTAFGGPAAHIALMRQEVVARKKWLTEAQFLDLIGAANLIPGPSSTEVAIYVGYRMAGVRGLLLAGTCFILPAFLMVWGIASAYTRFGNLPRFAGILYGVKPVVIAVILQALYALGRTAIKKRFLAGVGMALLVPAFFGVSPLGLLLGAGLVVGGAHWTGEKRAESIVPPLRLLGVVLAFVGAVLLVSHYAAPSSVLSLPGLFWVFLKLGSVVYGSGYVLLTFLRADLVTQRSWLTSAQLLDAVAVGQVTPGPVFTTATFIGYVLAGPQGAVAATLGIFLPAFLFVGITGPMLSRLRQSAITGAFLDGVNVAALALMAVVAWQLARAALVDGVTITLAVASALLLLRYRVNSAWLVLGGAIAGLLAKVLIR